MPVPHPQRSHFPVLVGTSLDAAGVAEMGLGSAKAKPIPVWEHWSLAGGAGTAAALERPDQVSRCFLCFWRFSSPFPAGTAQLPPKTQHINLEMFCEALEEREGGPMAQKCSISLFSKQFFYFQWLLFCGC